MAGEPYWAPWNAALRMDLELLRRLGATIAAVGPKVERSLTSRASELAPAAVNPAGGWSTAAALTRAVEVWRPALTGLGSTIAGHGNALTAAADAQARADAEAAARSSAAGGPR